MSRPGGPEPDYAEYPGYGLWPCSNPWHATRKPYEDPTGACPDCPNAWWAADGTECPEEYALVAQIDWLRGEVERVTRAAGRPDAPPTENRTT